MAYQESTLSLDSEVSDPTGHKRTLISLSDMGIFLYIFVK